VGDLTRCLAVTSAIPHQISTVSRLHKAAWARHLALHQDKKYANLMLQYIDEGVPILYEGPEYNRVCKNWNSTITFKETVLSSIVSDVEKGRKSGPFDRPPLTHLVGSPMGAFMKKRSAKVRVIHDLCKM
jgi:hypothetical protein